LAFFDYNKMKEFKTHREENFNSRLYRFLLNLFPAFRRSTGRVSFFSSDWMEMHVCIKRNWKNRNYNGSVYGGSIYSSIDPMYAIQLLRIFGDDFVVWDKKATIDFQRPIKKKAIARFEFTEEHIEHIRKTVLKEGEYRFEKQFNYIDKEGFVYATIEKTIYIARKDFYQKKIEKKKLDAAINKKVV